jgi:hypothetical protein
MIGAIHTCLYSVAHSAVLLACNRLRVFEESYLVVVVLVVAGDMGTAA